MQTADFAVPRLTVLHGHLSQETAYLIEDHPYSFTLRCKMRYWLDTAVKGQFKHQTRMFRQSTNPRRGDNWNPPKAHTNFAPFMVMYLDPAAQSRAGEDYVRTLAYGPYLRPADHDHIRLCGAYEQLTDQQRQRFDALAANSQATDVQSWDKWAEWKDRLRTQLAAGNPVPAQVDGMVLGHYLWDTDKYQVLVAAVLAERTP